jgi:5-methylcytosine-specific restriction protein B
MTRIHRTETQSAYAAAAQLVEQGFARQGSLFTPQKPVWTSETLADLHQRDTAADDTTGGGFVDRLRRRLEAAPAKTVQLAAELAYAHVLFASDLSPSSKRRVVTQALRLSNGTPEIPNPLDEALDHGLARTTVAFKLLRMSQLSFLATAAFEWWRLAEPDRRAALGDPRRFKSWLWELPHHGAYAQREALLHLVHPDSFEPIASRAIKQRIVHSFSRHVPAGIDDVDEALVAIRAVLERRSAHGSGFIDLPSLVG